MLKSMSKKGAISVKVVVAVIIAIILLVGVAIPITQDVITSANLTGLTLLIVGFIPVFIAIAGLIVVTNLMKA